MSKLNPAFAINPLHDHPRECPSCYASPGWQWYKNARFLTIGVCPCSAHPPPSRSSSA